ncbi:subunit D/I family magnesium chelatase [Candidatus Aerophobetes bacterium Ae_b3a]|nr:MAG: subunit D/I family magnesium chelatase [Candidatus Aerophobetes bacterium Ae_b3a]
MGKGAGFKISRAIADLGEKETINSCDVSQALQYRYLDRDLWRRLGQ